MSTPTILKETMIHYQKSLSEIFHMASTITFFCGAGVSTSAGIPDFRSPGGLYAKSFLLDGVELRGDRLFDVPSLQNSRTLALMNLEMTKLRLTSRSANIPGFQQWVARLNKQGRLRRCYTQNFDGLQLRADWAMSPKVYEVHGSNQRLRCHTCSLVCTAPIENFDRVLGTEGLAQCINCQEIADKALASKKRHRPIGYLVPDILFNQQAQDISLENKGWDLMLDTEVDLFVIAGTSLKTEGTLKLVKAMAQNVRLNGGVVVYVDRGGISRNISNFVDIYFRVDTDIFSYYLEKHVPKVVATDSNCFRSQLKTLVEQISTAESPFLMLPSPIPPSAGSPGAQPEIEPLGRIVFVLLHTARNGMEADAYGQAVVQGVYRKGYQVELVQQCIGSFLHIPILKTQGSHVFVAFLTSSILLGDTIPVTQDIEVAEMLYFTRRMIQPHTEDRFVKVLVLGHYDSFNHLTLAQRLQHEVQDSLIDTLICGLSVASPDHLLWAEWSTRLFRNWARVSDSVLSADDELETIRDSWLETDGLYLGTNLWYFCNHWPPLLVLSSPWSTRPLGRPLPDVSSACGCSVKPRSSTPKHWKVTHNAKQGGSVSAVTLDVECSACKQSWRLDTSDMIGIMRAHWGRFAVELDLIG